MTVERYSPDDPREWLNRAASVLAITETLSERIFPRAAASSRPRPTPVSRPEGAATARGTDKSQFTTLKGPPRPRLEARHQAGPQRVEGVEAEEGGEKMLYFAHIWKISNKDIQRNNEVKSIEDESIESQNANRGV